MKTEFRSKLMQLLNSESMENGSDTPDFILAEYLTDCLDNFDRTVRAREKWYGRQPETIPSYEAPPPPLPERVVCISCKNLVKSTDVEVLDYARAYYVCGQCTGLKPPPCKSC